jgi:hypothetical protein
MIWQVQRALRLLRAFGGHGCIVARGKREGRGLVEGMMICWHQMGGCMLGCQRSGLAGVNPSIRDRTLTNECAPTKKNKDIGLCRLFFEVVWFKDRKEDPLRTTVKPDRAWIRHVVREFRGFASFVIPNALFFSSR